MTQLVWPNGSSTNEPNSSDGYGPRAPMPGTRPFHVGHDWYGIGSLKAIGTGTVVSTDPVSWAGWQVLIDLGVIDGVNTWVRYAHLASQSPLTVGSTVNIGDTVGTEGNTGVAFGVHLHMEIYRGAVDRGVDADPGATVDPRAFIAAHLNHTTTPNQNKEPIMAVYLRPTTNSSPLVAGDPTSSRIWAGDNRVIGGVTYSGVFERSEDGSIRRLFPGEWTAIQAAHSAAGRPAPYAETSGNEIEKMYLIGRHVPS